jgi:PAT family beta-lactamase induction signal transducer AmpG
VSLAERRWLRITTLCVLYVAQGIPWGFMATTLPGYLVAHDLDFGIVTTTLSFTTLPYSFKWIWGPIIDRFTLPRFGRRRPWIIFAQLMMALTIGAMLAFDVSTQIKLLAWMVFIHTVFNALQDVSVDALAVEILPEDERGRANGLMYGAKYAGGGLGGVGMAKLIAHYGLDTALVAQVAVLLAIMLVPLLVRERSETAPPPPRPSFGEIARGMQQVFSVRSPLVGALLLLSATFAAGVVAATGYKLFIDELHWKYDVYAEIAGGWGLVVGCVCAANAGWLTDKLGRRRVAAVASVLLAATWVTFALSRSLWSDHTFVYVTGLVGEAFLASLSVALIALAMDLTVPMFGGSQFTLYMALSNFSTTLGYQFAGVAHKWWSFQTVYIVAAVIQLAVTLLLIPIDPGEARRELPLPEGTRVPRFGGAALVAILTVLIGMTAYITIRQLG